MKVVNDECNFSKKINQNFYQALYNDKGSFVKSQNKSINKTQYYYLLMHYFVEKKRN